MNSESCVIKTPAGISPFFGVASDACSQYERELTRVGDFLKDARTLLRDLEQMGSEELDDEPPDFDAALTTLHRSPENVGLEDMELREDGVVPAHTHNPENGRLLVPRLAVMREAIQGWATQRHVGNYGRLVVPGRTPMPGNNPATGAVSVQPPRPICLTSSVALLVVDFYHHEKALRLQECVVRSDQTLESLCDVFDCIIGKYGENDIETVNARTATGTRRKRPSFFFIENVFYNDTRAGAHHDAYSKPIMAWREKQNIQPAFIEHPNGMKVKFEDLSVVLHKQYLFQHEGHCEHHVVFTDIRLPRLEESTLEFPRETLRAKVHQKKCQICQIFPAEFVTLDEEDILHNPCRFCKRCFEQVDERYKLRKKYTFVQ
eukprot:m.154762 g.154762  ORF g.154762 m.154762 type:complete len:376 (-) comp15084_c0_seq25:912-2039(-)